MDLKDFQAKFTGDIITPSSEDYYKAIDRWATNAIRRAELVAFIRSAEDAALALRYATSNNLPIAVKGGGHSAGGASSVDGGLVVDLSRYLTGVVVDEGKQVVRVQGGAIWKTVDEEAIKYGLATVGGTVNHTGVGGLIVGGGYGWLSGKYGLAIDNLLEATVVTADGQILTASETSHPDLFWGIRGGGSNFGIVTEFVLRLYPQRPTVFAGALIYIRDHVPEVAKAAEAWFETAGEDEAVHGIIARGPDGNPCLVLQVFYNGSEAEGRENFKAFYDLKPVADLCGEIPFVKLNELMNNNAVPGRPRWMRGGLRAPPSHVLSLEVFDRATALSESGELEITIITEMVPTKKINSVDPQATPFRRDWPGNTLVLVQWQNEKTVDGNPNISNERAPEKVQKVTDELVAMVEAPGGQLAYANYDPASEFILADGKVPPKRSRELFQENYSRLQQVKAKYDPKKVFNKWFVVEPATE